MTDLLNSKAFLLNLVLLGLETQNVTSEGRKTLYMIYWIFDNIARDLGVNRDLVVHADGLAMVCKVL